MTHAQRRAQERCERVGLSFELINQAVQRYRLEGRFPAHCSAAILLKRLSAGVGEAWGVASNGDQVWAIVRDGTLVTVMFRRSTQPATPQAFDVDYVL